MKLIEIPQVNTNLVDIADVDRPEKIIELAKEVYQMGGRAKMALAACLYEIKENDYWVGHGKSFADFCFKTFGYAESTANALMQVYSVFVEKLKYDPNSIGDIPWASLAMIVPHADPETAAALLSKARTSTQAELRKYLKDMQGMHVTQSSSSGGHKFMFRVTEEQAEIVNETLEVAADLMGAGEDTPPGLVYEYIFADFLISNQDCNNEEHLVRCVKALEQAHNVTISYTKNPCP